MGKPKRQGGESKRQAKKRLKREAATAQRHSLGAQTMHNEQQEPGLTPANQNLDSVEQEAVASEETTTEQVVEATEPGEDQTEVIAEPGQTQAIPAEPTNESAIDEPNTL